MCSGGCAPRRSGLTCGQKAALEDSHKPAAPGVAGPHPDCAAGPGEGRKAHEAVDLHLATPTSDHPCQSHLSARVSLYSSLQKKPTVCHFTTPGGGSGVVGRDQFSRSADLQYPERFVDFGVGARVALLGPMGRAASMVAPSGFGLPALRQEGRPSRGWTAPTTAWVDRVGNAQGTVDNGPLSLRSHFFVSVVRDLGRFAKRLCAWMFPPELSCEVVQDSTNPGHRGLLSPEWVGHRAVLQRAGRRTGGNSPAPAKLSLKRHLVAPLPSTAIPP